MLWVLGSAAVVIALIVAIVMGTTSRRGPRYRPGLSWWAEPTWVNGPDSAQAAADEVAPTQGGGGARARW